MSKHLLLYLCFCFVLNLTLDYTYGILHEYKNPYFHFPYGGPYMGFLTAFALPLKVPTPGDVFISVNFEATYSLPENQTEFFWPPIVGSATRQLLYNIFERKLESHGYPGKPCILRAICEGAEYSTAGTGVLGDVLHVILTPSSSLNVNLTNEYHKAEVQAKKSGKCRKYRKGCSFSVLNLFSWIGNLFDNDRLANVTLH